MQLLQQSHTTEQYLLKVRGLCQLDATQWNGIKSFPFARTVYRMIQNINMWLFQHLTAFYTENTLQVFSYFL